MRKILLFSAILLSWNGTFSNPILVIDPYGEIVITEVYRNSSNNWSIELDGDWFFYDSSKVFPCSATVMIQIGSRNITPSASKAASIKIPFNKDRLGIITQQAFYQQSLPIPALSDTSVIFISHDFRSLKSDNVNYWSFQLQPVKTGNSLVMLEKDDKPVIRETSRVSIGKRNSLLTQYVLRILDGQGKPLSDLQASGTVYYTASTMNQKSVYFSDSTGRCKFTMSILDSEKTITIYDYTSGYYPEKKSNVNPDYRAKYIDNDTLVTATLNFPVAHHKLHLLDIKNRPLVEVSCKRLITNNSYRSIPRKQSSIPGLWNLRLYPSESEVKFFFMANDTCQLLHYDPIENWSVSYSEKSDTTFDTLIFTPTSVSTNMLKATDSDIRFYTLPNPDGEVHFIITSPRVITKAKVQLLTLSGKKTGEVSFKTDSPGTYTVVWMPGKQQNSNLSSGTYLCRLIVDGNTITTSRVTIP